MKTARTPQVIFEAKVLKALQGGGKEACLIHLPAGIPKLYWYGSEGEYNIMVMDFLGTNLEDLQKECGGKLSMLALCYVAE